HSSDIAIKGAPQAVELQKGDVQSQASQDQVSQNQVFQNSHFPNPEFHDVNFISQDFQNQDFQNRRYEVKFVTKVGEERWLDVMTAPMPFEGAAATLAVAMDITGRKEVEENLVIQKTYLERLIESAPEAIVIVSNLNVILRTNCEFERLFGYDRDEVLGKPLDPLIVPEHKMQESRELTE